MFEKRVSKNYKPDPSKVTQGNLVEQLIERRENLVLRQVASKKPDPEQGAITVDREHQTRKCVCCFGHL